MNEMKKMLISVLLMLTMFVGVSGAVTYSTYVDSYFGFNRIQASPPVGVGLMDFTINVGDTLRWINDDKEPLTLEIIRNGIYLESIPSNLWGSLWGPSEGTYEFYIKEYPNLKHQRITVVLRSYDNIRVKHKIELCNPASDAEYEITGIFEKNCGHPDLNIDNYPLDLLPSGGGSGKVSASEMVLVRITMIEDNYISLVPWETDTIIINWYDGSDNRLIASVNREANSFNLEVRCFIGHFSWEINKAGKYYVDLITENGDARVVFDVISVPQPSVTVYPIPSVTPTSSWCKPGANVIENGNVYIVIGITTYGDIYNVCKAERSIGGGSGRSVIYFNKEYVNKESGALFVESSTSSGIVTPTPSVTVTATPVTVIPTVIATPTIPIVVPIVTVNPPVVDDGDVDDDVVDVGPGCWDSYVGFGMCVGEIGIEIGIGIGIGIGKVISGIFGL